MVGAFGLGPTFKQAQAETTTRHWQALAGRVGRVEHTYLLAQFDGLGVVAAQLGQAHQSPHNNLDREHLWSANGME